MKTDTYEFWINVTLTILFFIALTAGFAAGYMFKMKDTKPLEENPLSEGIKRINKANKVQFTCSCISTGDRMSSFTFDEKEVYTGNFWFDK